MILLRSSVKMISIFLDLKTFLNRKLFSTENFSRKILRPTISILFTSSGKSINGSTIPEKLISIQIPLPKSDSSSSVVYKCSRSSYLHSYRVLSFNFSETLVAPLELNTRSVPTPINFTLHFFFVFCNQQQNFVLYCSSTLEKYQ